MTHYLISVYEPEGPPPGPELLEPMGRELDAINEELKAAGAWVFGGGLHPPSTATVLRASHDSADEVLVTDGPYVESKEFLGGFTIVDVPDLDAAMAWAGRYAKVIGLPIEVRPFARGD